MEDIVLNKKNFDIIRNFINEQITNKYGINIKNQYDDDISVVMKKMWEKNSNKKIANPKNFLTNWNQKVIEYCTNMIDNSIQSAYLGYSNNTLFGGDNPQVNIDKIAKERGYGKQTEPMPENIPKPIDPNPIFTNQYREQINQKNASELFEKIVANRGIKEQEIRNKGNLDNNNYSSNNYQNNPNTYKNTIPPQKEFLNASNTLNNSTPIPESDLVPLANNFIHPNQNILPDNSAQETLDEFFKSNNLATQFDYNDKPSIEGQIVNNEVAQRNMIMQKPIQNEIINAELQNINLSVSNNNLNQNTIQKQVMDTQVIQTQTPDPLEEIRKQQIEHEKKLEEMNSWLNNNTSLNYPLIPIPNMKLETQTIYFVVDSFYRDLEVYPSPTNFVVNFGNNSNSIEINSRLNQNGVVIYDKPKLFEAVEGNGATLENRYSNVFRFRCVDTILPFDRKFIGQTPFKFNGGKIDENVLEGPAVFRSNRFGPIWTENDGLFSDITEEPYYMLIIDELQSPYDGTSKDNRKGIAKLIYDKTFGGTTQFLRYRTSADETYEYSPTSLGTLSRMSLKLVKYNNVPLNLGIDKIFVSKIEEGEFIDNCKYGPELEGKHLTKITIDFDNPEYKEKLCSTGLYPGDILFFSSKFDYCNGIIPFKKNVKINIDNYPVVYYYIEIEKNGVMFEEKVIVNDFLKPSDYLTIDDCIYQIKLINPNQTILVNENNINPEDLPRKKLGFSVNIRRGVRNDENLKELNSINGFRVAGNNIDQYSFEIMYPYESLPIYFRSDGCYYDNCVFFIQHRKQISYTFQIEQLIKSQKELTGHIVSHSVT
jgi:hypothetical protein